MKVSWRNFSLFAALLLTGGGAHATDVSVTGLFSGKAVISVNGGKQQVLSVGQKTPEGIRLVSADSSTAVLEIDGKRQTLGMGQVISSAPAEGNGNPTVTLSADARGHFVTLGSINGASMRFLVDTGASFISFSNADAKRMGISYLNGERMMMSTANGNVQAYRVTLNTVKVGSITLNQVDAVVHDTAMPVALLGMSFLKRLEMRREGNSLTLTKKY